jgi:putative phosphonate metabolism protein
VTGTPRYALYFTPKPDSDLARFGNAVLGYDNHTGAEVPRPDGMADLAGVTDSPRLYGFHATLKAPMRLALGVTEADLLDAAAALAADHPPVPAGRLHVATLGAFTALIPQAPPPELGLFAAECVAAFEPFRAPLTEAETARRRPERLTPRGRALLARWGYPHVFEDFRFHMTLTDALPEEARAPWRERLAVAYGTGEPLTLDALSVLRQDGTAPFRVVQRIPFGG